ncbi:MAG: hypothetical protein LW690_13745 [Opitutaceae bacterium]|jgi:hypothetical protein|nr:hypothetical protein [Opitutaceae bacterium]
MSNIHSSSPVSAKPSPKRKRVGAALVSPFRQLSSPLRPVRRSATTATPFAPLEKPVDPPAA